MTIERIAAAIKPILDEDRRADRERIAELERDLAGARHRVSRCMEETADANVTITELDGVIAELTEKCAALVVENKRLAEHAGKWVNVETPAVEVKRTPKARDRVRILNGANAGEIATVRAIDSIDPDCFCLMLANGERWFAHVDNLEVIE